MVCLDVILGAQRKLFIETLKFYASSRGSFTINRAPVGLLSAIVIVPP